MNIWLVNHSSGSTLNNILQLFGLLLLFVFILAATYLTSKFVGQFKLGQLKNKNFKVIESYKVSPNKFLQLIKMGNKYVVISVGKDEIHYITELSQENVCLPTENTGETIKFADFIAKIQKNQKSTTELQDNDKDTKDNSVD